MTLGKIGHYWRRIFSGVPCSGPSNLSYGCRHKLQPCYSCSGECQPEVCDCEIDNNCPPGECCYENSCSRENCPTCSEEVGCPNNRDCCGGKCCPSGQCCTEGQCVSCCAAPCACCQADVTGRTAFFEGQQFTLGTPHEIVVGDTVWAHDAAYGAYDFYKDTFMPESDCVPPFTVPIETITLTLYCVGSTWVVEASTYCLPKFVADPVTCEIAAAGYANRLIYGEIPCVTSGGGSVPAGAVSNIAEGDGSPFLNPNLPDCGAPGFSFGID